MTIFAQLRRPIILGVTYILFVTLFFSLNFNPALAQTDSDIRNEYIAELSDFAREINNALYFKVKSLAGQVAGIATGSNHNTHDSQTQKHSEHEDMFNFVANNLSTHVAVRSGNWFDPTIWDEGVVPPAGARVVILDNVRVTYAGISDTRLQWVRVNGTLTFASNANSRLVVDTLAIDPEGTLIIGTESNPVSGNNLVEIVITNDTNIDVSRDRQALSRGVISHGKTTIHGEVKTVFGRVAIDPRIGDTSITMAQRPTNWKVGDVIVIAGTEILGYSWDNAIRATRWWGNEDEVRTITAISDRVVSFDQPLIFNHLSPATRSELKTYVANYTRNITFRNDNPNALLHRRGHFMIMHNREVDIRYASFIELGRTNKSENSREAFQFGSSITSTSNVRGRYPLHIHRSGVNDPENPVIILGNAVFGSPGWGYVHHDSNAIFHNNASYDTFGAGYVAETGNEIGTWTNNIAIFAQGRNELHKDGEAVNTFDGFRAGVGFGFQGRLVRSRNNVAASTRAGYLFMHRGDSASETRPGVISALSSSFEHPEAVYEGERSVSNNAFPILGFHNNEAFASPEGLHVVKANPNQNHDIRSVMSDFTAWNVEHGAVLEYTSHYLLKNFDVVARRVLPGRGITLGNNVTDMTILNPVVDGFQVGIHTENTILADGFSDRQIVTINPTYRNNQTNRLSNLAGLNDVVINSNQLVPNRMTVTMNNSTFNDDWRHAKGRHAPITGSKSDSIGTIALPAGTDNYDISYSEFLGVLATEGYRTVGDEHYILSEHYFSDRATGEIHKYGLPVLIPPAVAAIFPHRWGYPNFNAGPVNFSSRAPVTQGEAIATRPNTSVLTGDLLRNDSDPENDTLILDGFTQPQNGQAFLRSGNQIVYQPDFDFVGTDTIKYWVTDGNNNFSPAYISINVSPNIQLPPVIPPPELQPEIDPIPEPAPVIDPGVGVSVSITGVTDDQVIQGSLTATAVITPNETPIRSVIFAIDRTEIANLTSAPFRLNNHSIANLEPGEHLLTVSVNIPNSLQAVESSVRFLVPSPIPVPVEPDNNDIITPISEPLPTPALQPKFQPGDQIITTENLNVRSVAGLAGNLLGLQARGSQGVVVESNAIVLDNFTWARVDFATGADGWVVDSFLTKRADTHIPIPEPTVTPTSTSEALPMNLTWNGLEDNQVVNNKIYVSVDVAGVTKVSSILFRVNGKRINRERTAPYALGGDKQGQLFGYDTSRLKPGVHTIEVLVTADGQSQTFTRKFITEVANGAVVPPETEQTSVEIIPMDPVMPEAPSIQTTSTGLPYSVVRGVNEYRLPNLPSGGVGSINMWSALGQALGVTDDIPAYHITLEEKATINGTEYKKDYFVINENRPSKNSTVTISNSVIDNALHFGPIVVGRVKIIGTNQGQAFFGRQHNDLFEPGGGNNWVDGSSGEDTMFLSGRRSDYTISNIQSSNKSLTIKGLNAENRSFSIERFVFTGSGESFTYEQLISN